MATDERRGWVSEYREDNKTGHIVSFDGKTFDYDVEGLTEYSIEQNRAKAIEKANKHFDTTRGAAQHDFANEKAASDQSNPV